MSDGCFIVSRDSDDPRDIRFSVRDKEVTDIPQKQVELKEEVERSLTVLRGIFPEGSHDDRFEIHFKPLLQLSQAGLVGPAAQPETALRTLRTWKSDLVAREGGQIKNGYMKKLGLWALGLGGPSLLIEFLRLSNHNSIVDLFSGFGLLWFGCMAGVWLSFGVRKTHLEFEELHILEEDRLDPPIRLLFAGLLTLIIGLILYTGLAEVAFGGVNLNTFWESPSLALLLGALAGISEKALPSKVVDQATAILNLR